MRPELWGGVECTINRVGDRYADQMGKLSAYAIDDLVDRLADIGFTAVRWPVLWERIAPAGLGSADWSWADRTLGALRAHGIEPIVGLVHHGSGPPHTSLLDPAFASGVATFAAAVARRYPWIRYYTPINEPLTTARFSCLYGHWFPHTREDASFVRALVHQVLAVSEAMRAVRDVSPAAQLVQTEDAGSTRATDAVQSQATFENDRRWLSLDLLTGHVNAEHPLWRYVRRAGIDESTLERLQYQGARPDIVGLNYYVTSDRFLDHRLARYPASTHGGNGRQRYADIEAARADAARIRGHADVLREAWERYRLPVAITEAHIGCTREEQLRWLRDAWGGATAALEAGADVRAVTVWALLGSVDWDSLVTREAGHYEPGVFDVRGGRPRPTALAGACRSLAATGTIDHPAVTGAGWWTRPSVSTPGQRPVMVVGASGTLGHAFLRICERRGLASVPLSRADLALMDPTAVRDVLARHRPWVVINAAGYVRVDAAERDARRCRQVNAVAPAVLAMACRRAGIPFVTFSSDLVFDGERLEPYTEDASVGPLNVYGRSKVEAERRVQAVNPRALVVRTSSFFGPWDSANFVTQALGSLARHAPFRAADDLTMSPTYVPDLVDAVLDLAIDGGEGLWHLANAGAVTWYELAVQAARVAGLDSATLAACPSSSFALPAVRPRYSVLGSSRGGLLPSLEDALDRYAWQRASSTAA